MTIRLPRVATGKLPPTDHYELREWGWLAAPGLGVGATPVDGLLGVRVKPFAGKPEQRVYGAAVEGLVPFDGFVLLLQHLHKAAGPYRVAVGPERTTCTCDGGRCRPDRGCVHAAAVSALVRPFLTEVFHVGGVPDRGRGDAEAG